MKKKIKKAKRIIDSVTVKKMFNKSMKGYYVYVKRTGVPGRYYRYRAIYPPELYLDFYVGKLDKKIKGRITDYKKSIVKKKPAYKPRKTVETILKKGVGKARLMNALKTNEHKINRANYTVMKKLIKDQGDIKLAASEQTLKKMKHRFEFNVRFYGNEGEVLATMKHIGRKTLRELVHEINNVVKEGDRLSPGYDKYKKAFKRLGYNFNQMNRDGFVRRISVNYTGRKV